MFAHSRHGLPEGEWERLRDHAQDVAELSQTFAEAFGWGTVGYTAGFLHDIGKASDAYQAYIASPPDLGRKGPDHSTAGAVEAERLYGEKLGRLIAFAVAGHHAGLADFPELKRRLAKPLDNYGGWRAEVGEPLRPEVLRPTGAFRPTRAAGFSQAFLTRMIFSCLVDADFLATERFYTGQVRPAPPPLEALQVQLEAVLAGKRRGDTEVNALRSRVLDHVRARAELAPGLFTLTVPTGGGKTLTSLAFALDHARRHGLTRVIYVIPYTSIIEQTAAVFREALCLPEAVLEHHASFDWEPKRPANIEADSEGQTDLSRLRQAAENWDAPVVVTTAVQFFESLFARRTAACRKLHNLAGSVVVLDEAQTLPLRLLRPSMAALDELAANYRTSVVLCTATQPALREEDGFRDPPDYRGPPKKLGFRNTRELAPDVASLFKALKRVEFERRPGKTSDAEIVDRFSVQHKMLCIVNSRRHARDLYDALRADPRTANGACHLTTLMCPVHRRAMLAQVRARLDAGAPVRLVATSLIEAGVDIDFPEVWRAVAGLDSIAQAAGRCNREGQMEGLGRVVVFEPENGSAPSDLRPLIESADGVMRANLDPLSPEAVKSYFQTVYWRRGPEAMDGATLEGQPWLILQSIADRADRLEFEFETIAQVYRLIDDVQASVVVPFDEEAVALLARVAAADRPPRAILRKLQQYAVSIPRRDRDAWLAAGVLKPANRGLGEALLCFETRDAHYREDTGVDLREPERRDAASNLV